MSDVPVPLLVCVSPDAAIRELIGERLDDLGHLLICADLGELRDRLLATAAQPSAGAGRAGPAADTRRAGPAAGTGPGGPFSDSGLAGALSDAGLAGQLADQVYAGTLAEAGLARPASIRLGALTVDVAGHRVTWQGSPLEVTRLERRLLARLASRPGRVWSYERLFAAVWGGAYLGDTAILHSAVKRLRRKLRAVEPGPQVQTVRGVGYRLALPD